jgi:hypothetical protein
VAWRVSRHKASAVLCVSQRGGALRCTSKRETAREHKPAGWGSASRLGAQSESSYFPCDLRVWLTFESEERSLLLTEVLSKQQTVFNQTTSVTTGTKATSAGMEGNKNSPSVDQINDLSPDYSMLNSSVATVQSNKYFVLERKSVNSPEDCFSLSTKSVRPNHDGAHGGCSGEFNHHHSSAVLRSSITVQMNCNGKSNLG